MVTRRKVLGSGVTAFASVVGTGAALGPMLATARGAQQGNQAGTPPAGPPAVAAPLFDEVYRGRRIQGSTGADGVTPVILVDGRPLRLMRRVDGTWISVANHFQPFATPLATARGAVDAIGPAQLAETAADLHAGH
jgi:hypothetical protein